MGNDLILAIQSVGVERGRNGFRKNQSMEKQPESEDYLLDEPTAPTAPMPSTPSTSAARSFHSTIYTQMR